MIPNLDIYRSANVFVGRHGEDAPIEAAMRADAMLEKGELERRGDTLRGHIGHLIMRC